MSPASIIRDADFFEVRTDPDDAEPLTFQSFTMARIRARKTGRLVYAMHPINGETFLVGYQ